MHALSGITNVEDFRRLAKKRLPRLLFDYIDGGSYSEQTLRRNVTDFERVTIDQHVMRDVSNVNTASKILGQQLSMPVVLAPVGLAGMYARRGEVQAASAAEQAGVPFCLSSVSICDIDEVATACGAASWFQLYMIKDKGYMAELLSHAQTAGCPVLVFTVDLPVPASRLRDLRSGLAGEPGARQFLRRAVDCLCHPSWLWDVWIRGRPHRFGNFAPGLPDARRVDSFFGWVAKNYQSKITWQDLDWIRQNWTGPIILKGILSDDDALTAVAAGINGVVVSNHGGRQLDGAQSSIAALPAIVQVVGGQIPVFMDGGIRSGGDILKALSLGADACLIGRAWAYALAAGGQNGVAQLLELLRDELRTAMALSGCTDVQQVARAHARNFLEAQH